MPIPSLDQIQKRLSATPPQPKAPAPTDALKISTQPFKPLVPVPTTPRPVAVVQPKSATEAALRALPSLAGKGVKALEQKGKEYAEMPAGEAFVGQFVKQPLNILKFLGQGLASSLVGGGKTILEAVYGKDEVRDAFKPKTDLDRKFDEILFGGPVESWQETKAKIDAALAESPVATDFEKKNLGTALAVAGFAADLFPGKPSVKTLTKEFLENLAKNADEAAVRTSMIARGVPEQIADIAAPNVAKARTSRAVSAAIKNASTEAAEAVRPRAQEVKMVSAKPETADEAAERYWNDVITPQREAGGQIVIGADDMKTHFDADYETPRHKLHSEAAFKMYERALRESPSPSVIFTGGGPGSGKTELVRGMLKDRDAIVYDSNLSSYEGARKQIEAARSAGKKPEIYGIIPDLKQARQFTLKREEKTGRPVSDKAFARGHAGFPEVARRLIEDGLIDEKDVHLLDTRGITTPEQIREVVDKGSFVDKPLETLVNVKYDEGVIANESAYEREAYARSAERVPDARVREEPVPPSGGGGPDSRGKPPRGGQDRRVLRSDEGGRRPRFSEAVRESPEVVQEVRNLVKSPPYERITNKDVAEAAKTRVMADPEAAARWVLTSTKPSAEDTATGIELIRHFQSKGDFQGAADIADTLATKLVANGQTIQAAKLLQRLSPEGVLTQAQKIIRDINTELGRTGDKKLKLDDDFAKKITDLAKQRDEAVDPLIKEELGWEIGSMLASLKRVSLGDKVATAQTIAQLLNPKTMIRNIIGNELFYRFERINKRIATPIDWTKSKLTGGPRLISMHKGQGKYWENFLRGARAGWKGVVPNALPTQLDIGRQVFKSKYNPLFWAEKSLGASLRGFDFAAYSRAKNNVVGEMGYLRALNEGKEGQDLYESARAYAKNADDNILQIADDYGKYVTFQDDNLFSKGLSTLKRGLNIGQGFGLGDLALKYPRTPGSILMRGIEYSPAGFFKSAFEVARPWFNKGDPDPREAVSALSRAITGTLGMTGLGYYLADKGIISASPEEDYETEALEQAAGGGRYRVNLSALRRWATSGFDDSAADTQQGDRYFSYDWVQPIAISLSVGANINDSLDDGDLETMGLTSTALESFKGGVSTLLEQPLVSGIVKLFQGGGFGPEGILGGISKTVQGLPASFVPTLSNQLNQWTDNTKRNAYDPKWLQQSINLAKRKIPGFAQSLPPQVDQFGRDSEVFLGNSNSIFNVFFNPGFYTKYVTTPESQLVFDVLEQTGDKSIVPRIAGKKVNIDGEDYELSAEEYENFQRTIGGKTLEAFGAFASSESFMALSDERKAGMMSQVLTDIGKEAKDEIFKTNTAPTVTYKDRLTFLEIKDLVRSGYEGQAQEIIDGMDDEEYDRYTSVRTSERASNTRQLRSLLGSTPADAVLFLRDQIPSEQERLLNLMTDEEYNTYEKAKYQMPRYQPPTGGENRSMASENGEMDLEERSSSFLKKITDALTPFGATKERTWIARLKEDTLADFPFEAIARGELADVKYSPVDYSEKGIGGTHKGRGEEKVAEQELGMSVLSDLARQIERGVNKPRIKVDTDLMRPMKGDDNPEAAARERAQEVMSHEMLHHLFDTSAMGFSEGQNDQNSLLLGQKWLEEWDKARQDYPALQAIDDHITKSGYDIEDGFVLATERFAYLGQRALLEGPGAIPKELRKFYKNAIRF